MEREARQFVNAEIERRNQELQSGFEEAVMQRVQQMQNQQTPYLPNDQSEPMNENSRISSKPPVGKMGTRRNNVNFGRNLTNTITNVDSSIDEAF